MEARQRPGLAIERDGRTVPVAFKLSCPEKGDSFPPVVIPSPYDFIVEGRPDSTLMSELRWYLEEFLDYPFYPETDHADRVMRALRTWGMHAFNALFQAKDAKERLAISPTLQFRGDDPEILSWPWEALFDAEANAYLAHQRPFERRLNLQEPKSAVDVPRERVNILLVVCRPYANDVRYRSIARPLIDLIESKSLRAHVDILRPPTFNQLREHLRQHPNYYHVLHFDGHGEYAPSGGASPRRLRAYEGYLIFENEECGPDPKSARDLSALLQECPVPAAVLNACQGGTLDAHAETAFASVATALLQGGTRSVVAMAYSLYVSGAQVFLPAFYGRLFESGSIAESVLAGRQQMLSDKNRISARGPYPLEDWLLPVLYQHAPFEFHFVAQDQSDTNDSRLPEDVKEHREAYGFIGRDGPILEMERAIQREEPCILVQGLGGVGKTTLARGFLRWLDETSGLDAALWFDFRYIHSAEHVLNRTGEVLYGEGFGAQPNKIELLANAMRDCRVTMVWDNFESTTENLLLEDRTELCRFLKGIQGTRGKVIVTARSLVPWMELTQYTTLPLGGLEGAERWEYCETILRELRLTTDRDDPALGELMDLLAGHPLAMRIVLPRLEDMLPVDITAALRDNISKLGLDEHEEQQRLFATLRFVDEGLPTDLRPMMPLIALHEGYLDINLVEAMAGQTDLSWNRASIDQLLALLADAGLVRVIDRGIFELHPLLTSYLRSRDAAPEVCRRAFVDVMGRAADHFSQREYHRRADAFLWYGASFRFAQHLSQSLGLYGDFKALTQTLALCAQYSGNLVEATRLFSALAEKGARNSEPEVEAAALHQLGRIAEAKCDFDGANSWYSSAIAVCEKHGLETSASRTYHQLGSIAQEQRAFSKAREWYTKALSIAEKGNLRHLADTYSQLGMIAEEERDFAAAEQWFLKSLTVSEKQGATRSSASTYLRLGRIAQKQRKLEVAQTWYRQCLDLFEQHGDALGVAKTYHQLGTVAQDQGQLEAAREFYLSSLTIKEAEGDQSVTTTYSRLGEIARDQRDLGLARQWFLKGLNICEKVGDLHGMAGAYNSLGTVALDERRFEEAGKWFVCSIANFWQTNDPQQMKQVSHNFGIAYQRAPPEDKLKLKAVWSEAGLPAFPNWIDDER